MEDFKKTINYLSQAIASLSCVFDLAVPEANSKKSRHKDPNSSLPSNFPETVPDQASHYTHTYLMENRNFVNSNNIQPDDRKMDPNRESEISKIQSCN